MDQLTPTAMAQPSKTKARFDNIDALRAIAISLVVSYHFTSRFEPSYYFAEKMPEQLSFGWIGVDLFFVVSAYCIFMTLESSDSLARFWAKRLARIQPAYMAGVLLTFSTVTFFGLEGREVSISDALANLVWLQVLPSIDMVGGAYWSLVVELKFYFWFGFIYFCCRGLNVSVYWAVFSCAGIVIYQFPSTSYISDKLLIALYAPQFLLGVIAYEWRSSSNLKNWFLISVAIILLLASPRFEGTTFHATLILGFGFYFLYLSNIRIPRCITFVGLVSYPLYLVHQNIGLVVIRELYPIVEAPWIRITLASALVMALAVTLHYAVESRWQRSLAYQIERMLKKIPSASSAFRIPKS